MVKPPTALSVRFIFASKILVLESIALEISLPTLDSKSDIPIDKFPICPALISKSLSKLLTCEESVCIAAAFVPIPDRFILLKSTCKVLT